MCWSRRLPRSSSSQCSRRCCSRARPACCGCWRCGTLRRGSSPSSRGSSRGMSWSAARCCSTATPRGASPATRPARRTGASPGSTCRRAPRSGRRRCRC
ncbi:Os10g0325750 [Oryza sativa Japonica Group]|uniref:Os10g0325750 protein n=1 Tax=Oryza sativa subsp. japonica TaxID=39947 RepID=A0A0P0XT32_ORYSJ|nr:hypothetical protein EE612_050666 [Oryza sativa]BAT10329.1 Os10g0325750 [Oryza sativa Japonica Group]